MTSDFICEHCLEPVRIVLLDGEECYMVPEPSKAGTLVTIGHSPLVVREYDTPEAVPGSEPFRYVMHTCEVG